METFFQIGMVACAVLVTLGIWYFVLGPGAVQEDDYEPYEPELPENEHGKNTQ